MCPEKRTHTIQKHKYTHLLNLTHSVFITNVFTVWVLLKALLMWFVTEDCDPLSWISSVPLVLTVSPPEKGNGPRGSLSVLVQYTHHKRW